MNKNLITKKSAHSLLALAMAGSLAFTTGCERPDWENPDYIARMLEEGDDRQRREAVGTLRTFPEDRRGEIASSLTAIYLEDRELRDTVMQHLIQWRLPGATAAYVEEMKTDQTGNAEFAGEALGLIDSRDSIPAMLEAFESTGSDSRRDGILRGLAKMPDPRVVDVALEVLALDVDNHRITMHSNTCDMVGELALEHPDAINEELQLALIRSVFLSDEVGRMVTNECRLAIQKVGRPITPLLVQLFNQENEDVQRLLMTYEQSTDQYQYPFNRAKHEATVLLTAIRAPEAVALFIADLQAEKEVDQSYSQARRQSWLRQEGAALNEMIHALGDLGDPSARGVLERIIAGELAESTWRGLIDDRGDFQFRQDGAAALARLGDRQARGALLRAAQADVIPIMARRFAAVASQSPENAVPEDEQFRPQWRAAEAFAYLAEAEDRARFVTYMEGLSEGPYRKKVASFLPAFEVADACGALESDTEKASCYQGFLTHESEAGPRKAIYELSRLPAEAAGPVIAEAISIGDLGLRELVTFAGYRVPSEELATRIDTVLAAEASRSAQEYRVDRRRLQMLQAFIRSQGSAVAVAEE